MNIENIISEIVNLPNKYNKLGNISIYFLLKETGYFENYIEINEVMILKILLVIKIALANGCVGQKIKGVVQVGILKKKNMKNISLVIFLSKKILSH